MERTREFQIRDDFFKGHSNLIKSLDLEIHCTYSGYGYGYKICSVFYFEGAFKKEKYVIRDNRNIFLMCGFHKIAFNSFSQAEERLEKLIELFVFEDL